MTNARKSREAAQAKAAELRRIQAAKESRRRILLISGALVLVVAIIGGIFALVASERNKQDEATASASLAAVKTYTGLTQEHVQGTVKYPQTPPVGGNHNPVWLNCGIYTDPVPNENAVHAMEHGAVWITYKQGLAQSEVDKLTKIVKGQTYIVLSPYKDLPSPIVATAWGKQLTLTSASDPRIEAFIKEYKQGKQTPEMGASCSGGVGTPAE